MSSILIQTTRLELRELQVSDAALLQTLDADPEVVRFINAGAPPGSLRDYESWIEWTQTLYSAGFGHWAAYEEGRFAGWFHYVPSKVEPDSDELGYRLNRDSWGRGLATEGSRGLLKWASERRRSKITARAMLANTLSVRVLQKVGFDLEREYLETRFPGEDKRAGFFRLETPPN